MIHAIQKTMKTEDSVFNTFLLYVLIEQQLYSGTGEDKDYLRR